MFGNFKDNLTSMAAKHMLTSRLQRYGKSEGVQKLARAA